MKVTVTGYQGFIGKHLIPELQKDNVKLGLIEYGDYPAYEEMVGTDVVVHLGAIPVMNPTIPPFKYFMLNTQRTVELLEVAKQCNVAQFIFISSCVVSYPLNNLYDYSKAHAEDWVRIYNRYFTTCILRLHNIYGESNTKGPVENWAQALKKKQPITITGDGSQERDMVYVGDVVRAIRYLIFGDAERHFPTSNTNLPNTWEFGTGQVISMRDLAEKMRSIWNEVSDFGTKVPEVKFVPAPYVGLQTVKCPAPFFFADMTPLGVGLRKVLIQYANQNNSSK